MGLLNCVALAKENGAKLVSQVGDILEEIPAWARSETQPPVPTATAGRSGGPPLAEDEADVLDSLTAYPEHVDDLTRRLNMEPGHLISVLLALELRGLVRQDPGKRFSRIDTEPITG